MDINFDKDYSALNKFKIMKEGSKVAIIPVGSFFNLATKVTDILKEQHNIDATLISPRYLSGIDEELLESLKKEHQLVVTLEDGIVEGGYGEKISGFYGTSNMKVLNCGFKKEFVDRFKPSELMMENQLKDIQIAERIMKYI